MRAPVEDGAALRAEHVREARGLAALIRQRSSSFNAAELMQ